MGSIRSRTATSGRHARAAASAAGPSNGALHLVAIAFKVAGDHLGEVAFVVHDQNSLIHVFHPDPPPGVCASSELQGNDRLPTMITVDRRNQHR
jgi:hypothetical protein